ncbi:AAA family ATPase [Methanosarcina mazei]|uniref:Endonuclease GajA/Old nuclease/RecF-like AAA domain-containing protein n=2 Tax=Methanosarcina mazei TaxID=2209 RepID=A0A0F8HPX2_METMZ|nr:AAA family ATPase [Methanosarcina mazei]AKB61756.1 hypothetical protein MSMAP_1771 [Methanosarcina mazei SarPi]KKG79797.1 hypothetical protein DU55_13040 [Methanosarcina mazei]
MKIHVENLGAVKNGDVDLKPLTIFIGPNNKGKTWTAYSIASLFSNDMFNVYSKSYSEKEPENGYLHIHNAVKQVLDKGNAKIDMADFSRKYSTEYINNVASIVPTRISKFLDSRRASFEDLKMHIELDGLQDHLVSLTCKPAITFKISVNKEGKSLLTAQKEKDDPYLYVYTESSEGIQDIPVKVINKFITNAVFRIIHRAFFQKVVFFPPERTGIVPFLLNQTTINESNDEHEDSEEHDTYSGISYPLMSMISIICFDKSDFIQKRKEKAENDETIKKFIEIAKVLEDEIIGGSVEPIEKPDGSQEIIFNLNSGNTFDIPITSSCVKDLIPLVFYLKYLATVRDLIVIDEPEMNLHPESQVKIMELLASLVNLGLNIIITTHSTYIVDHIPNLTKAYKLNEEGKKGLESKFKLKREDSFIDQNKISVYLFDEGTIKNIYKDNGFIDWGTFGDVSEYVSNLYFELEEE